MSPQRFHYLGKAAYRSFTLVELLVSIAIVSILLLAMTGLLGTAINAWRAEHSRVDNFTRARAMLDLIASDVQRGVFRPDLPAFGTGNTLVMTNGVSVLQNPVAGSTNAFFTRRAGTGSDMRDLSLVVYTLSGATNSALNRSYSSIPWTPSGNWSSALPFQSDLANSISSATPSDAAQGVVGFELLFQKSDGSLTNAYTGYQSANPVVGVVVSLAVADSQTVLLLNQQNNLTTLKTALAGTLSGTNSPKAEWDAVINTSSFLQNYPASARQGLKTFERQVYIGTSF